MDSSLLLLLGIGYACLNVLSFVAFGLDKYKAQSGSWRISENTLLILAACGPFGAVAGMKGFRHKTRHVKFFLVPVFAVLHAALILWLWPRLFS